MPNEAKGKNRDWELLVPWFFLGILFFIAQCHTFIDPDVWAHLNRARLIWSTGKVQPEPGFLSTDSIFVNFYWLFQLVLYSFYRALGNAGITLLFALVWTGIALAVARMARPHRAGLVGLAWALASLIVCEVRFMERPDVVALLIVAWQLVLLWESDPETAGWREILPLAALQILSCNVHGYFFLGPTLAGLWAISRPSARGLGVAALLAVLGMASPFGWKTWAYVYNQTLQLGAWSGRLTELMPPVGKLLILPYVDVFWGLWLATVAGTIWSGIRVFRESNARGRFALLVGLLGLALSARAVRLLPVLVIFSAPAASLFLPEWETRLTRYLSERRRPALRVFGAFLAPAVIFFETNGYYRSIRSEKRVGTGPSPFVMPIRFSRYANTNGLEGRLFATTKDGGYLALFNEKLRVLDDSLYADIPQTDTFFAAFFDAKAFRSLDEKYRFQSALVDVVDCPQLLTAFLSSSDWNLAYADLHRAYFQRGSASKPQLSFYDGEDLSEMSNGFGTIRWAEALKQTGRREWLLELLEELQRARVVPAATLGHALDATIRTRDEQALKLIASLYGRRIAYFPGEMEQVDALMRKTPAGGLVH